jgi:hypothetical protein
LSAGNGAATRAASAAIVARARDLKRTGEILGRRVMFRAALLCHPGRVLSSMRDRDGGPKVRVRLLALVVALLLAGPLTLLVLQAPPGSWTGRSSRSGGGVQPRRRAAARTLVP